MNRIITIGREFGSGGREFGQRLADALQVAYYDKEIVSEIARRTELAEQYVQQIVEKRPVPLFPLTTRHSFGLVASAMNPNLSIYQEQTRIIEEMARKSDCVIVGRCADYILSDAKPFRIFLYADMASRIERCRQRATDAKEREMSDKEMERMIRKIDKSRAAYYEFYTGQTWGEKSHYDLCLNTACAPMDEMALAIAGLFQ